MEKFDFTEAITHSTIFHADDVFGVAFCRMINPKIKVIRTLEVDRYLEIAKSENEKAIVFDIGLGKYDHHQRDKIMRSDGITPYCGFGLLWKDYGYLLCPEKEAWSRVDSILVAQIDSADNGICQNLLSQSIKAMNPTWKDDVSENDAFESAVSVATTILKAQINQANSAFEAKDLVLRSYFGGGLLILDKFLPWTDAVLCDARLKDVLFVIYPSKRSGWNVQTVPKMLGRFGNRMDFPSDWLGHADPERGITFSHTSNFLISCVTKEQAIKVAEEAIGFGNEPYLVASSD